jgi:hypothetical protein
MIKRMSPEWISENWEMLREAVRISGLVMARKDDEELNRVLESLLVGRLACWTCGEPKIHTLVLVSITLETISGTKNALIYCAHSFRFVKPEEYIEMAKELGERYKNLGCSNILLYTSNEKLVGILEQFDADVNHRLIMFPLVKN